MVLAAMSKKTPLEELATLADKIMEVALPSIATVAVPPQATSKVENLRAENASLLLQTGILSTALQAITSRLCRQ